MDYFDEFNEYYDDFSQPEYFSSEEEENYDVINDCIFPTLSDGFKQFLTPILVTNLILRFLTIFIENVLITRLLTIASGLSLLYYHLSDDNKLLAAIMVYLSLCAIISILGAKHTSKVWIICILLVIVNESLVLMNESLIRLRPHIMLLVMKVISFNAFITQKSEKEDKREKENHLISSLSYLLHPLSLLLGVWHPFQLNKSHKSVVISLIECVYYMLVSIVFLLLSTCLLHHFVGQTLISHLVIFLGNFMPNSLVYLLEICLTVYISAQQFRFSHYFICFATQSMLCLWNSDLRVTNPMSIEFPRSLVDVVVAWNIPMHLWLKTHVFSPSKRKFGSFQAIFVTYLISSFLHGFNFQIWSVLLSLGVLTKLEYDLREELSKVFNSCINVRRCLYKEVETDDNHCVSQWKFWSRKSGSKCISKWKHRNTPFNSKSVPVVNFLFSVLAVTHLSYLGSTFDGKEESSKVENVLTIWKELKFFSHIVSILTFIFYKII